MEAKNPANPLSSPSAARILCITSRADIGGGSKHVHDLLLQLHRRSEIQLYCSSPANDHYTEAYQNYSKGWISIPHRRFSFVSFLRLIQFFYLKRIDVIHSHGRGAGAFSRLLGFFTGTPVIHTFHGISILNTNKSLFFSFIERILARWTAVFVCVSESERDLAISLNFPANKIQVIPNGINPPATLLPRQKVPSNDRIVIGILCRLDNDPKNLFKTFQLIADLPPKFHLHIGGDGPDRVALEDWVQSKGLNSRFKFFGAIKDPENFLNNIDIFISLSYREGLPYAVIESLVLGRPAILSDIPPHIEIVKALDLMDSVIVIPSNSKESLSIEMIEALAQKQRPISVEHPYMIQKMASKLLSLYIHTAQQEK